MSKQNINIKYLYFVFKEVIKYAEKLSDFRLNIIKDLLSKVIIENNFFMFINVYNQAFSVLTECHCDLNLFEATKFFIFRLYQYDFYKKYSYILKLYNEKSDKDKIGYIDLYWFLTIDFTKIYIDMEDLVISDEEEVTE